MNIQNKTLEELAAAAQSGNTEVVPLLWERTERLIKMLILKHINKRILPNHISEEDILQCGYFALLAAVKAFKPNEYKFNTYLNYSVQNTVNEAINGKSRQPSKYKEYSYNRTVSGEDNEETELVNFIKDKQAEFDIFEGVELSDTRRIVIEAVAELEPKQYSIIRRHYFLNMTLKQIAEQDGCSLSNIQRYEQQAFRTLRKNQKLRALNEELRANIFIKSFNPYNTSPEYYNAIRTARELERKLLRDQSMSYGQRQAQIFMLMYKAEREYKRRNERVYRY